MDDIAQKSAIATAITIVTDGDSTVDSVRRTLGAVRSHLGMDVAYVSEFVAERTVFRQVDAPGCEALIKVGDSHSLDDVYCRHILEGRIPELMPDTSAVAQAAAMPITKAVPIGAHVSVPIRLPDGRPYGMFCCLSFKANPSLNDRDLQVMRAFADLTGFEIERELESAKADREKRLRVMGAMEEGQLSIVYQPVYLLTDRRLVGFECLARFAAKPVRSPEAWFDEAAEVGLGTELECAAIRMALDSLPAFPPAIRLAVNASPPTIVSRGFADMLDGAPAGRIVVEVTERVPVGDYVGLVGVLTALRQRGVRLAVDDAGSGYASLRHILELQPDLIKLDMELTRNIDLDPARRALAAALISFARDTGSEIVAEGVETASELKTLRALGVEKAQGYLLGRPMSLAGAVRLCGSPRREALRTA